MTPEPAQNLPRLRVRFESAPGEWRELYFTAPFRIGRTEECEVCVPDGHVSRAHAQVSFDNGQWWVTDLGSSNGIFAGGERVETAAVAGTLGIRLGIRGPEVSFEVEPMPVEKPAAGPEALERYIEHYFGKSAGEPVGAHTMLVRQAFQQVQTRQKRRYWWIAGSLAIVALAAGGYALYLHRQFHKQTAMAQDLFYAMKSLDLDIANVERLVADTRNPLAQEEIRKYQSRRQEMERNYDRFLSSLRTYNNTKMTPQERLILRVARVFGECELTMPPGFVTEVENYIRKWQSSGRLAAAIARAKEGGYTARIAQELLAQGLPPQFFYVALQESGFDPYISGPMTRKGIAKGMWQFVPETAVKYGLRVGPLMDLRRPDPGDDRDHWERATGAAARYLKDLYATDAEASGLLVMACYNWGEDSVLPLVRSMPANPRERNFWRLLSDYRAKLPNETYDYVFYIASAAVIGENPKLFGFNFENPLGYLEGK